VKLLWFIRRISTLPGLVKILATNESPVSSFTIRKEEFSGANWTAVVLSEIVWLAAEPR